MPLAGAQMTGPLFLVGPPSQPPEAVTKQYIDELGVDGGLYG